MELLIFIIGMACLGHLVADVMNQIKFLPDKPFKCNMCMTFWISIIPSNWIFGDSQGILISAIAAILSEWIYKKLIQ